MRYLGAATALAGTMLAAQANGAYCPVDAVYSNPLYSMPVQFFAGNTDAECEDGTPIATIDVSLPSGCMTVDFDFLSFRTPFRNCRYGSYIFMETYDSENCDPNTFLTTTNWCTTRPPWETSTTSNATSKRAVGRLSARADGEPIRPRSFRAGSYQLHIPFHEQEPWDGPVEECADM